MTTLDLFATATTTAAPQPTKAKGKQKKQVMLSDLSALAAVNALQGALEGIKSTLEASVKSQAIEEFVKIGMVRQARPENMEGIDEFATASVELRKRSTASILTEDEAATLTKHGVKFEEITKKAEVPELFYFNSEVLTDPIKRAAISKALSEVPELKGTQVIMRQQPEPAVKVKVVTDESIDQAFQASKNAEDVAQLVKMCTVLALKTKLNSNDLQVAFDILAKAGLDLTPKK
jgi:hypothetical protein